MDAEVEMSPEGVFVEVVLPSPHIGNIDTWVW